MRFILSVLLLLLAVPSYAQDIVVRTGDHLAFTRVVFAMPPNTPWEVVRSEVGYDVKFDSDLGFETDQFFDRIQQDRISDFAISETASAISFILACDCFAEAYLWREDRLVVDIKDVGEPRSEAFENVLHDLQEDQQISVWYEAVVSPLPQITSEEVQSPLSLGLIERAPIFRDRGLLSPLRDYQEQQERVASLESAVSFGLERALSQGLLLPVDDQKPVPVLVPINSDDKATFDIETLLSDVNAALVPGIASRTSVDPTMQSDAGNNKGDTQRVSCFPEHFGNITSWATTEPFQQQIGELRLAITGEFDRTDPNAIEALAKAYIHFGFGREAINILAIDGSVSRERQFITALGQVIDDDPVSLDNFDSQMTCSGPISIWAFLAHHEGPKPFGINLDEIVVAYKLLPVHLREHLSPRLASKLVDMGESTLAESVLSHVKEDSIRPSEVAITASEIAQKQGDIKVATDILDEMVIDDPRMSPIALLDLIELKINNNQVIGMEELELLRIMQFENQHLDLINDLNIAEAEVHFQMQNYDSALDIAESQEDSFSSAKIQDLHNRILFKVTEEAADIEFLQFIFGQRATTSDSNLQNRIAERLLNLGFLSNAESIILGPAIGSAMAERRYLRAEIASKKGDAEKVDAYLAGISTQRAQQIRAEVGFPVAIDVMSELPRELQDRLNLEQENWPALGLQEEDELLRSVANRRQSRVASLENTETPLATSRDLIEDASLLRNEMSALLERFSVEGELGR